MSYLRAEEILPKELIEEIQQYVDGKSIYIPSIEKKDWGSRTDTREELQERNRKLFEAYRNGATVKALAEEYFLCEKSVQRIIRKERLSALPKGGRTDET